MNVANLLATKGRDVATINQERTVRDAVAMLKARGIGALVVVGGTGPLTGILSERDVVRAFAREGDNALDLRVAALMSTSVTTCEESTSVNELMTTMTEKRIRHVPVVQGGLLVGIVSIGDVVKARVTELENEKRDLLEYVSAR
ncbi:MAG: CBS domain-containing protein [Acidimicrobiales bacterium]